ncbi:hypothetical protein FRX31_003190, partial [Thalictrum thalictroides]
LIETIRSWKVACTNPLSTTVFFVLCHHYVHQIAIETVLVIWNKIEGILHSILLLHL